MARIRTIKPEFWTDERLADCSLTARLLLIASLNFADDYGNLERSARQLKAQAFPYDQLECEPLVRELLNAGLMVEYKVADRLYLHIKGFQKHQRIEKRSEPRLPKYECSLSGVQTVREEYGSPPVVVTVLREGNVMEGKGRECTESTRATESPRETESEEEIRLHVLAIKAIYPKASREDWITAEKLMRNIVRDGCPWHEIEAGVGRYQRLCKATHRIAQNPGLFFAAVDRPWLQEWPLPASKAENRLSSNISAAEDFMRRTETANEAH